jgi:hypothetical protein
VAAQGLADFIVTDHAASEMTRRQILLDEVRSVALSPEQRIEVRPGRIVLQSRIEPLSEGRQYLLRVIVDVDRQPAEIVTAYRTSKINKYWSADS